MTQDPKSAGGDYKEKIEIFLSCQDLVSKDMFSKTDAFVVDSKTGKFEEIGRTETIKLRVTSSHYKKHMDILFQNLFFFNIFFFAVHVNERDEYNPSFGKSFVVDFAFEEEQEVRFDVYDQDKNNAKSLKGQDFIGCCNMTLGEIMHASGNLYIFLFNDVVILQMTRMLLHKGKSMKNGSTKMCSRLTARIEVVAKCGHEGIVITFGGEHLASMDFFGKSDPFLEIYRMTNTQPLLVYRTEKIDNTEKPVWKPITISSQELCNSDPDRSLLLRVLDWDSNGSHELIGEVKTTLNALRKNFNVELENGKKKGKKVGTLKVVEFRSTPFFSFLDYVMGGIDLSLMVAIDFTASNGKPSHSQSLHHLSAQGTQYQLALRTIANTVSCYDSDQRFPVWGFASKKIVHFFSINFLLVLCTPCVGNKGGKIPHGDVMHVFPLNGNDMNPEVRGVYGIEEAYLNALAKVELFGPTLFYPILKKAVTLQRWLIPTSNIKLNITLC
ncbi:copine family member IX [Reticulomyxa filosa]|uniref:Copine family member IX n=1 Tax=Reticulomyxa filosa TaxID=46433 RepID=X6MLN4_RETFI|nr:copine family member IX [Reticulomyxa filosa]|eukprot:ETO14566.1 copine family member IX [Reticulomyxa filosa]